MSYRRIIKNKKVIDLVKMMDNKEQILSPEHSSYNRPQLFSICKYRVFKKRALQWYSKCYCVASVTKTFTLKGIQINHRSTL
jgi:hypothetical protein